MPAIQKKKQAFNLGVKAYVETNTLDLFFLDTIKNPERWDYYYECMTEGSFVQEIIDRVNGWRPTVIRITIDSFGGSADIGFAVYNFLLHYAASVEVDIIGFCGSIATIIAYAADPGKLRMAPNGFWIIHPASGAAWGTAAEIRRQADVIELYTTQMLDIYSKRTGKTPEEIVALWADGDYWLSGDAAHKEGWVDALLPINQELNVTARIADIDTELYHNVPDDITAGIADVDDNEEGLHENTLSQLLNKIPMKFKVLVAAAIAKMQTTAAAKPAAGNANEFAAQVTAVISAPLEALAEEMQQEIETEFTNRQATMTQEITAAVNTAVSAELQTLREANERLSAELIEKTGNETRVPQAQAKTPIGSFVGGPATAQ